MGLFDYNDVGIDLGTASVLVYVKGKGIVMREPSVVAVDRTTGQMLAIGEEARIMLGRTPGNIVAVRPLRDGVISNFHDTERMLRYFLRKVIGAHRRGTGYARPPAVHFFQTARNRLCAERSYGGREKVGYRGDGRGGRATYFPDRRAHSRRHWRRFGHSSS